MTELDVAREMWDSLKPRGATMSYDGRSARAWLAAHDAEVRAVERKATGERIAVAIEKLKFEKPTAGNHTQTWNDALTAANAAIARADTGAVTDHG